MSVKLTTEAAEIKSVKSFSGRNSGRMEIDTNLEVYEIIEQIGERTILDVIGAQSCIDHFQIEAKERES